MHGVVRESLEGFLSGNLQPAELERVERHLRECRKCQLQWEALQRSAMGLRSLRPPRDLEWVPPPGFYGRLLQRIDQEREVPFWSLLIDPSFGRRLVFACLVLLAVLGGYVALQPTDYPSQHRPEAVLAGHPAPPLSPAGAPFGSNLQQNRGAVLVALADGD